MKGTWDLETQEFHGGQSWRDCDNFVADFSVTTTPLGAPKAAVEASKQALEHIQHYPNADCTDARMALAKFCNWTAANLLVGNGASEFIDMMMRVLPSGAFCAAPYLASYQEYHRAARAANRPIKHLPPADGDVPGQISRSVNSGASVMVFIRPNSPTGECLPLDALTSILTNAPDMHVLVDESFLPFAGPSWHTQSALRLIEQFPQQLIVVQSWTKLWSCAGLRVGSLCASEQWIRKLKKIQTPWSCNSVAQAFVVDAAADNRYLELTWTLVPRWREVSIRHVKDLGWKVVNEKEKWLPWILIKCPSSQIAAKACKVALSAGCPVRPCVSYNLVEYIRVAVREPEVQDVLFNALKAKMLNA